MKVIIPLAGKGTRLRPHTLTKPKPMIYVAGKPVLGHILDSLKGLKISEIIFVTGSFKESIEKYVSENYKFKTRFVEQKILDGSAGSINVTKEFIAEDVLIIFSDTLFDADLKIKTTDIDGAIWASPREDYQRFGVLVLDSNGYVKKIVEKPTEPISKLANIGLYYIKNYALMFEGIDYLYKNNINLNGEFYLVDAFQYMIDKGAKIVPKTVKGWYDCGKIDALLDTNQVLLKRMHDVKSRLNNSLIIRPVFIDKNVQIENSIIGPNVSIAAGTSIKNSIIKNSILSRNVLLEDMKIKDSTIGDNVVLKGSFKKLHIGDNSEILYSD